MPDPTLIAAAASGIQNMGTQLFNAGMTGIMNRKARKWQEKMYARQREDALSDWMMQNEYNHPSSQMARLREANLNPNLVYGNGVTTEGGNIRSSDTGSWKPDTPRFDPSVASDSLMNYMDTQVKQAQIDNLRTANTVQLEDAALKRAQTANTNVNTANTAQTTARSKFDLELASDLRETSVEAAKASLKKTQADTKFTLDQNERAQALQANTLQQGLENILTSRMNRAVSAEQKKHIQAQIDSVKKDIELKQLDINLKKSGVQPGDALWQRVMAQYLSGNKRLLNKIVPEKFPGEKRKWPKFVPNF